MKSTHDVLGEFQHALKDFRRANRTFREVARIAPNSRKYLLTKYGLKGYRIKLENKFDQVCEFGLDNKETLPHIDLYAAYSGWWDTV